MKEIIYTRLDDRLVHGQIVAVWLNDLKCDVLCVIDDKAAKDPLQQMMLKMAVPKSVKFKLCTLEQGVQYLNEESNEKVFLILGNLETVLKLVNAGITFDEVNLGNIGNRKDRKQYSKSIWLSDEERQQLQHLIDRGLVMNVHLVPSEKKFDVKQLLI